MAKKEGPVFVVLTHKGESTRYGFPVRTALKLADDLRGQALRCQSAKRACRAGKGVKST